MAGQSEKMGASTSHFSLTKALTELVQLFQPPVEVEVGRAVDDPDGDGLCMLSIGGGLQRESLQLCEGVIWP